MSKETDVTPVIVKSKSVLFGRTGIIRIVIAAAVLLIVGIVVYLVLSAAADKKNSQAEADKHVEQAVNGTVLNPNIEAAQTELEKRLTKTTDTSKKAAIYVQLLSIASQEGNDQSIVDYGLKAIELDSSQSGTLSYTLAQSYQKLGNKTEAIKYYKQALTFYSGIKDDPASGSTYFITDINAQIKELEL